MGALFAAFPRAGRLASRGLAPPLTAPGSAPGAAGSAAVRMQRELGLQESNHSGFVYTGRALLLAVLASLLRVDVTYAREGIPLPV